MLIALPFVALPEPHRHAVVSSARRLTTSNVLNEHAQRVDDAVENVNVAETT
jgi:hypothetical protein